MRDLLDDLSDEEGVDIADPHDAQLSGPADSASGISQGTAQEATRAGCSQAQGVSAPDAKASSAIAAAAAGSASGAGLLGLPEDVLLTVLRQCARNDWLSLACACGALRAAAFRDELWLSEPELQRPAITARGAIQPTMPAAAGQPGGTQALIVAAADDQPHDAAARTLPPNAEPPTKRARRQGSLEGKQHRPSCAAAPSSTPQCTATSATTEQEPAVGSGGTYLGLSQRGDDSERPDSAERRDGAAGGGVLSEYSQGADGMQVMTSQSTASRVDRVLAQCCHAE